MGVELVVVHRRPAAALDYLDKEATVREEFNTLNAKYSEPLIILSLVVVVEVAAKLLLRLQTLQKMYYLILQQDLMEAVPDINYQEYHILDRLEPTER